jgi:hypothetical protein
LIHNRSVEFLEMIAASGFQAARRPPAGLPRNTRVIEIA